VASAAGLAGSFPPDLVAVLMTQVAWTSPEGPKVWQDFWTGAYQAIE